MEMERKIRIWTWIWSWGKIDAGRLRGALRVEHGMWRRK
jgi:hypothetical protein